MWVKLSVVSSFDTNLGAGRSWPRLVTKRGQRTGQWVPRLRRKVMMSLR